MRWSQGPPSPERRPRVVSWWAVGSLGWTVLATVAWLIVPTGVEATGVSIPEGASGNGETTTRHVTLLETEGLSVLPVLLAPIAFPLLALIAGPSRRPVVIGLAIVYLVLALLAGASIGLFFLPAAVMLLVAGVGTSRSDAMQS
jgi:hypothetical protein